MVSTGDTGAGEVEKAAAVVVVALAAAAGVARGSSSSSTTWIRGRAGGMLGCALAALGASGR